MADLRTLCYLRAFGYEYVNLYDYKPDVFKIQNTFELENLQKQIQNCTLCTLSKYRKKALALQNHKASIMIIKEFVSKGENESGLFFEDTSGQRLKKILCDLQMSLNSFYISSIYKCFGNEKADTNALHQCLPYTLSEIELLCPKLVVVLGQNCFEYLGFDHFKAARGNIFDYKFTKILASFELDFIHKNPSYESEFIKDLQKIRPFL